MNTPIHTPSKNSWLWCSQCYFQVCMVAFYGSISILAHVWEISITHVTHISHFGTLFDITYDQNAWAFRLFSVSFSNSSLANSRTFQPLGFVVSCMTHPIFFKTSTHTTISLTLMHVIFAKPFLHAKVRKIFVFGHTFLQSNKTSNTWLNQTLKHKESMSQDIGYNLYRSLCTNSLKTTQISA
jgi:hypothetical protein